MLLRGSIGHNISKYLFISYDYRHNFDCGGDWGHLFGASILKTFANFNNKDDASYPSERLDTRTDRFIEYEST